MHLTWQTMLAVIGVVVGLGGICATIVVFGMVKGQKEAIELLGISNANLRDALKDADKDHAREIGQLQGQIDALTSGLVERVAEKVGDRIGERIGEKITHAVIAAVNNGRS